LRYIIYQGFEGDVIDNNDTSVCSSIQFSKYGNSTFSSFVFAFTITYLFIPMFTHGDVNFWLLSALLIFAMLDIYVKYYNKCSVQFGDTFLNVLSGCLSSVLIISLMYSGGSSDYLFFNELSSTREMCSLNRNQTFKCSVYKNGQLLSSI
jgi:hypothetical protein